LKTPRLHVVTDDETLARPSFLGVATALLDAGGPRLAVHVRGHASHAALLHGLACTLVQRAAVTQSTILVNDRVDVAMTSGAHGIQLGRRSVPLTGARRLLPAALVGFSAHSVDEVVTAESDGADFVVLGTIWRTRTHAGSGAGPGLVEAAAARSSIDIIPIGGVTPDRVAEIAGAGGRGAAVLSGVWNAADPMSALALYLAALESFDD